MTRPAPHREGGFDGIDLLIVTGIGVLAAVTTLQWLIGNEAALLDGRVLHASPAAAIHALLHLPQHLADPRDAWPAPARAALPGPVLYWLATTGLLLAGRGGPPPPPAPVSPGRP